MECSEEGTSTAFISPNQLRPILKAGPRKTLGGRRKESTRILTDSPIKAAIEKDAKHRSDVKNKSNQMKLKKAISRVSRPSSVATKPRKTAHTISSKGKECPCCVCRAVYGSPTNLKSKEEWHKCRWCTMWAHESCGDVDPRYFECYKCWESD